MRIVGFATVLPFLAAPREQTVEPRSAALPINRGTAMGLEAVMNLGSEYTWSMNTTRKPYPSDVSDDEWHFVVPYLTLMRLDAPQRDHDLRAVFNALRWIVRAGAEWRMLPHDFPPWEAVYQQSQRWLKSGAFAA